MSKYIDKAISTQQYREKLGFSSSLGKSLAKAVAEKPFTSLATGVTIGGLAGGALQGAAKSVSGLGGEPIGTSSYEINRALRPGIGGALTRVKADEILAQSMTKNVGDLANQMVNETIGNMAKGYKKLVNKPKQQAILKDLLQNDEMLRDADPAHVASLFNTMVDVAPRMTKYKDAVKSFLRQGIAHEGGLDPVTLGELAKAEARLSGKGLSDS
jgi:hypothetical protein